MASSREMEVTVPSEEQDDDVRGDGKKKKFKPFEAVRKFFGKKRKKDEGAVVAVKARSTTALHARADDDDDDGGFKNRQPPLALVGTRSISEDSVFSPEQRETNLEALKKSAVSEESLPKASAFQTELFSKLNKRRSQYSDDDRDDGLPSSPTPPVTMADVIMGGPLKPLESEKKSSNRESDQSLISLDNSDNEEDDLFSSHWKSAVPARKSSNNMDSKQMSPTAVASLDFEAVETTEVLRSDAAKDRISIKPKNRKATRQSRKKRDTQSPSSLPSLNEESSAKTDAEKTATPEATKTAASLPGSKVSQEVTMRPPSGVTSTSSAQSKARPSSTVGASDIKISPPSQPRPSSIAVAKVTPGSTQTDSHRLGTSPTKDSSIVSPSGGNSAPSPCKESPSSGGSSSMESKSRAESEAGFSRALSRSRDWSTKEPGHRDDSSKQASFRSSVTALSSSSSSSYSGPTDAELNKPKQQKDADNQSKVRQDSAEKSGVPLHGTTISITSGGGFCRSGAGSLKPTDQKSGVMVSPKEDYKIRRQNRSKTLPGASDEQYSPKIQRASSHRIEPSPVSAVVSASTTSPASSSTNVAAGPGSASSPVGKLDAKRWPSSDTPAKTSEPAWVSLARKKQAERSDSLEDASPDGSKSVSSTPIASSFDKKRGSIDTDVGKKRGNADADSSRKHGSVDCDNKKSDTPGSRLDSKRESIEIDISELTIKDSGTAHGRFQSSGTNKSRTLPAGMTGFGSQDSQNVKPVGISPYRGGSVKTSPSKTPDSTSAFANRGGSVKTSVTKTGFSTSSASPGVSRSTTKADEQSTTPGQLGAKPPSSSTPVSATTSSAARSTSLASSTPPGGSVDRNKFNNSGPSSLSTSANRSSKVLDMVKNFQNLQVS